MPLVPPPPPLPVLFTGERPAQQAVVRADPTTLRPVGRRVRLTGAGQALERSPDGGRLAVLALRERAGGRDVGLSLDVLDGRSLQRLGTRRLRGSDPSDAMAWLRDDRLLLVGGPGADAFRVTVLDPSAGTVVARAVLPGGLLATRQVGDRLAVVVYDEDAETMRLVLLDADGAAAQTVDLPLSPGYDLEQDPVTGHVLALGADAGAGGRATVADVDPVTGARVVRTLPPAAAGASSGTGPASWRRATTRAGHRRCGRSTTPATS